MISALQRRCTDQGVLRQRQKALSEQINAGRGTFFLNLTLLQYRCGTKLKGRNRIMMKTTAPFYVALALAAFSVQAAATVGPDDVVFDDSLQVTESLTGAAGDPVAGRKVFADRKLGNCLACHKASDQSEQLFHGEIGPTLDGVGARYPEGLLRTVVINAKKVFSEETVMPGFYTLAVGERVAKKFQGKTILSAQQVEDVVAYLKTFKQP